MAGGLTVGGLALTRAGPAAAAAAPAAPADYQPNQKVEAREGDTWSPATVLKKEGRKVQIKYDDGTEEWVTADRLRAAGSAPAVPGVPAPGPATPGAAAKPGAAPAAAAKPPAKEQYAVGAKVEAKEASTWKPATIKNRDGDLYLVVFQGWEPQFHWQWVHVSMVRNLGDTKAGPKWARGVGVHNSSIPAAKAEAVKQFANIERDLAGEKAEADASGRGDTRSPFDPKPYDKPVTTAVMTGVREKVVAAAAAKLAAAEPIDPAVARLGGRPVVLKGDGGRHGAGPDLYFAGTFALAVHADQFGGDVKSLQAERVNLATGATDGAVAWDTLSVPLSIAPSGKRILGRAPGFHSGTKNRVDLWDLPAATGAAPQPKHLVSFLPYRERESHERDVEWAALTDDEHALTCSNKGELIYWKVGPAAAAAVWRMTVSGGARQAVLSPGGKRLACLTSSGLAVLDVATGDTLALIDAAARNLTSLDFSPDGKQVVGVAGPIVSHWDLEKGTFGGDIGLPPGVNARSAVFANDGFVLLGGTHLLDLARKTVVWKYEGAGGPVASYAGRVWTTLTDGGRKVLVSADLPQDKARKAAAALGPALDPGAMLLRPGATVSLEVAIEGTDEQRQGAITAITAQLKQNGIAVADGQPVKVVARTENGKTTEMQWQSQPGFGPGGFGGPMGRGPAENASVTEKITRIFVEAGGKVAWENQTVSVPYMVNRKAGQSVAEAVGAANTFNLEFLKSVRVPGYLPRPKDPPEQGVSKWATSGVRDER